MDIKKAFQKNKPLVKNAPLGTRLQFNYGIGLAELLPGLLHSDRNITDKLKALYLGDVDAVRDSKIPIVIYSATFRASRNHLKYLGMTNVEDIERVNINAINLVEEISNGNDSIVLSLALGSMGDAYEKKHFPSVRVAKEYHREQLQFFSQCENGFVNAVTLPSVNEALGVASAIVEINKPYLVGFVLDKEARLFDGSNLEDAIIKIDDEMGENKPLGFSVTCTHANTIKKIKNNLVKERLVSVLANGSDLSFSELDLSSKPIADTPEKFVDDMLQLKQQFPQLKMMGGCCGTDRSHLKLLAERFGFEE